MRDAIRTFATTVGIIAVIVAFILLTFVPMWGTCIGIPIISNIIWAIYPCGASGLTTSAYLLPIGVIVGAIAVHILAGLLPSRNGAEQSGNGCGCSILAVIGVLIVGGAIYLAVFDNRAFPGSDRIRSVARSVSDRIDSSSEDTPRPLQFPGLTYQGTAEERARIDDPHLRHADLKREMVELANQRRTDAGVPSVRIGSNNAAQLHAEAMLDGCYSSHWDQWGLKPYMRHSITGGTGANGENGSGSSYCIKPGDNYAPNGDMSNEVAEAVSGWMESPGHRRTLLDPAYTVLNIGIAYDRYNTFMVQHFATDYVTFSQLPDIDKQGVLEMAGTVERATLDIGSAASVQILYDPPPRTLTRRELSYTYSLCNGLRVAYLVPTLGPNQFYPSPDVQTEVEDTNCVDPYHPNSRRDAPNSPEQASIAWVIAKSESEKGEARLLTLRRITAQRLSLGESFKIKANLSDVINDHGKGVYTVLLWGRPLHMNSPTPLAEYSIFWQTEPPVGHPYADE